MKVSLLANPDWYLYNFRLRLSRDLRGRGHEIVFVSPPGPYGSRFEEVGFRWLQLRLSRRGMNPLVELATVLALIRLYRRERPGYCTDMKSIILHSNLNSPMRVGCIRVKRCVE